MRAGCGGCAPTCSRAAEPLSAPSRWPSVGCRPRPQIIDGSIDQTNLTFAKNLDAIHHTAIDEEDDEGGVCGGLFCGLFGAKAGAVRDDPFAIAMDNALPAEMGGAKKKRQAASVTVIEVPVSSQPAQTATIEGARPASRPPSSPAACSRLGCAAARQPLSPRSKRPPLPIGRAGIAARSQDDRTAEARAQTAAQGLSA